MDRQAISSAKTIHLPPSFAGKCQSEQQMILRRITHFRRERRRIQTCISTARANRSFSVAMACTDESASEATSSDERKQWLHFVGVGGCGISALAMLALKQGYEVSGSDLESSSFFERLRESGARLHIGHSASNLRCNNDESRFPNALIVSSAIPQSNVEILHAKSVGIPVDYWLGKLTQNQKVIAVSGSHGKSSTTSMLAYVLREMGDDLSAIVGAEVPQFTEGNVISGSSETFVLEADEYDGCFLKLSPDIAIVTNVEWEHVDKFPDEESVKDIFRKFLNRVRKGGHLILCGDSEGAYSLLDQSKSDNSYKIMTFGVSLSNEWHATSIHQNSDGGSDYTLCHRGFPVAEISLKIPGLHNVLNSLAVIVAVVAMVENQGEISDVVNHLRLHLKNFRGISRRFEAIGGIYGCYIVDDYAHHPTEIRAVIQAARQKFPSKALLVVFQPHTYSRLAALKDDFAVALAGADEVIVTEVYASREEDNGDVSGDGLSTSIVGPPSEFIHSLEDVVDKLLLRICKNPHQEIVILTLGAGDITTVGRKLLYKLQEISAPVEFATASSRTAFS